MRVLFDADIVLDILLKRPRFADSALALARTPEPWLTTLSVANICYITGRSRRPQIEPHLAFMRKRFRLAAVSDQTVARSIELELRDFEDGIQLAAAEEVGIRYLVTGNLSDFISTDHVQVLSVSELIRMLERK